MSEFHPDLNQVRSATRRFVELLKTSSPAQRDDLIALANARLAGFGLVLEPITEAEAGEVSP